MKQYKKTWADSWKEKRENANDEDKKKFLEGSAALCEEWKF